MLAPDSYVVDGLHGSRQDVDDHMLPLVEVQHTTQCDTLWTGGIWIKLELHCGAESVCVCVLLSKVGLP